MAESDQKPDLIKEYLRRLTIQEKSGSFNDYAERLTHLSIIRDILTRLSAEGYASSEGTTLLGTREQPLGTVSWGPPDFVVLREDVLIYVYLIIGPTGELTATQLQGVWTDLKEIDGGDDIGLGAARDVQHDGLCAIVPARPVQGFSTILDGGHVLQQDRRAVMQASTARHSPQHSEPECPAADIGLAHGLHRDGRLNARLTPIRSSAIACASELITVAIMPI